MWSSTGAAQAVGYIQLTLDFGESDPAAADLDQDWTPRTVTVQLFLSQILSSDE